MVALEQAASARELTPSPSWSFLISISYAVSPLLFPACPGICFFPSLVQCFLQKTTDTPEPFARPQSLIEKSFLVPKRNEFGGCIVPPPLPLCLPPLPPAHPHNPFCLRGCAAFPSSRPSFCWPVTHCAGKSDFLFSQGSKLKAQPRPSYEKSHSRAFG